MSLTFFGALLFAAAVTNDVENPRFLSLNGEMCVVIRRYRRVGDFERVSWEDYWRKVDADALALEEAPLPQTNPAPAPEPTRAALYRLWPGDYRELLAEFAFRSGEDYDGVLVADDGHVVTYGPLRCGAAAELATIRAPDGSVVRTLRVRDVLTPNDQQWLCRGEESDVRFSVGDTLRLTMLVTDGRWEDPAARLHTIDIGLAAAAVAAPDRDYCPPALLVIPEPDDSLPRSRKEADVIPIASRALLVRAVVRVQPEYPEVAAKARISGRVGVQVVVGRDGKVEEASIVKPLPFGLDEAVRNAIMKWEFAPDAARVSGVLAFRFEIVRQMRPVSTHPISSAN